MRDATPSACCRVERGEATNEGEWQSFWRFTSQNGLLQLECRVAIWFFLRERGMKKSENNPLLGDVIDKYHDNQDVQLGIAIESMNEQLGNYLRDTRNDLAVPLESLAKKLGLTADRLSELEKGKGLHELSLVTIGRWARELHLSVRMRMKPCSSAPRRMKETSVTVEM